MENKQPKGMEVEKDKDAQKVEEEALANIEEDDDDFEDFEIERIILS